MPLSTKYSPISWPIAGGSYSDRSKPLSQQRTLNMYPEQTENGRVPVCLKSWPGLKVWSSGVASEPDRGFYNKLFKSKGYQVAGTKLYSIDSDGTRTNVGSVPGAGYATFADNGNTLIVVADNVAYSWDGTTFATESYTFTPVTVGYLNSQFLFQADDENLYISTPGLTTVATGNFFPFESSSDDLVRTYVYNQFVFGFGSRTVEPWENTGGSIPPFQRMSGGIAEVTGLAGVNAVNNTADAMYFLGADNEAYQIETIRARRITSPAVAWAFQSYGDNSSCRVEVTSFDSQDFILFIFPEQKAVWVYGEQTGLWFEIDHGLFGDLYLGGGFSRIFNKNLVADRTTGALYELDVDTYQNNGIAIKRQRTMRPISGEDFGNPRQKQQLRMVRFSMETGTGNTNEPNPKVMTEISTDGVIFDGAEQWHTVGREGERQQDISHDSNKYFTDLVCKIQYAGNTSFALYTAGALIREAGR